MYDLTPNIICTKQGDQGFFNVTWSALTKAEKYDITLKVPSVSGVYELYRMDSEKKLNLLTVTHAWYGGLRSQLREAVDPEATTDPLRRSQIENKELYYRFAISPSLDDIIDVIWFLHSSYFPNDVRVDHSGRFSRIHVSEKAPDKVFWLD